MATELSNANIKEIHNEYSSLSLEDNDILVFYNDRTKTTRGILAKDMFPNTSDLSDFQWASTGIYDINDPVIYNGQWWISDVNNNEGNIPTDGPYWTPENKVTAITAKPWTAGVYDQHYSLVERNGLLYRLKGGATLPLNSQTAPELDTTNWEVLPSIQVSDAVDGPSDNWDWKKAPFGLRRMGITSTTLTITISGIKEGSNHIYSIKKNTASDLTVTFAGTGLAFYGYNDADYNTTPSVTLSGASGDVFDLSFLARTATEIGVATGQKGN